jgi:hypothetical protein
MLRLEHGHGKGEWHRMEEVRDPAQHDSEREWGRHKLFRCSACEDEIRIETPDTSGLAPGQS